MGKIVRKAIRLKQKRILPRHGKLFAKPIRVSPAGRKQVGSSPKASAYVAGFQGRGLKGLKLVRAIVGDIKSFREVALPLTQARNAWLSRTPGQILTARNVVIMNRAEAARTKKPAIIGCTDRAQATVACLRAIGLPTLFVRQGTHSMAKFLYKGKVYIADARNTRREMVREMTGADKKLENQYRAAKAFAEGASPAQIGLNGFGNFYKYRWVKRR